MQENVYKNHWCHDDVKRKNVTKKLSETAKKQFEEGRVDIVSWTNCWIDPKTEKKIANILNMRNNLES